MVGFVQGGTLLVPNLKGLGGKVGVCSGYDFRGRLRPVVGSLEVEDASVRQASVGCVDGEEARSGTSFVDIYDTTLRDGSQGEGISLAVEDKLRIAQKLDDFGVSYIEGGWPGSNPKDAEFFAAMKEIKLKSAKLCAFGSTRYKHVTCAEDANIRALIEAQTPVVTIVGKAWDMQVEVVLEASLEENLAMISESVSYLKKRGKEVMLDAEHFFDGYLANPAYAMRCLDAAGDAGADVVVLCDTNGGSSPWEIGRITFEVARHVACRVGIHAHNDMELAVANSLAAVRSGASVVQGTANGYGERTGNANLMSIMPALQLKLGYKCLPENSLGGLTELSRFIDEQANRPHVTSRPFVGSSAFAHKGGLHVAAVMKNENTYQHIDPKAVGNQKRVLVSELSGRGNIVQKAQDLGLLKSGEVVDDAWKRRSKAILQRIKELENQGYTFEGAEASVELMIRRSLPGYEAPFELVDFTIVSGNKKEMDARDLIPFSESQSSQATVKMRVVTECTDEDGCPFVETFEGSEGNGPVNALNKAMMKALTSVFPSVQALTLIDYKVRILDNDMASEATTRVMIEFMDEELKRKWSSVSAHPNIIVASVNALMDGYEYGMLLRTNPTPG
ncbi:hypothetical protein NDN08_005004 [Rhodosorus marinus]|uniref:(R)-citramalate synthase n=1 Tax=Rhodosorus marinus TaxID=101924 RepID=A0AAV8UF82_9RHOD|nr:hypothetical protein NDN08_005004 [Rhodosorus marinus]